MLAQVAARLSQRRAATGGIAIPGGVVLGDDGETVPLDENCAVSEYHAFLENRTHGIDSQVM